MNIFNHLDYKRALKEKLLDLKTRNSSVTFEAMAEACRVQKTYLSKVLNHEGHLNEDQLELAAQFLNLNSSEKEFLALLRSHATSILTDRKRNILDKIEKIQKEHLRTETKIRVRTEGLTETQMQMYYLDPLLQVLHMYLTVPAYAKSADLMASRLKIDKRVLEEKLSILEEINIIQKDKGHYRILKDNLHLAQSSPLFAAYRSLLRAKSHDRMEQIPKDSSYSFSVLFSTDEGTRKKIQQMFLDYLQEVQKLVQKGKEEEVYQINFDLLPWT